MIAGNLLDLIVGLMGLAALVLFRCWTGLSRAQPRLWLSSHRYRIFFPSLLFTAVFRSRLIVFFLCRELSLRPRSPRLICLMMFGIWDNWHHFRKNLISLRLSEFLIFSCMYEVCQEGERGRIRVFMSVVSGWPLLLSTFLPSRILCPLFLLPTLFFPLLLPLSVTEMESDVSSDSLPVTCEDQEGSVSGTAMSLWSPGMDWGLHILEVSLRQYSEAVEEFWEHCSDLTGGVMSIL